MRPLTEEETKTFFEKLSKYIGENIKQLIDRSDGTYCFRLHRERVYYVSERIMKQVWHDHILYILRVLLNRSSFNYKIRTGLHICISRVDRIHQFFLFYQKVVAYCIRSNKTMLAFVCMVFIIIKPK